MAPVPTPASSSSSDSYFGLATLGSGSIYGAGELFSNMNGTRKKSFDRFQTKVVAGSTGAVVVEVNQVHVFALLSGAMLQTLFDDSLISYRWRQQRLKDYKRKIQNNNNDEGGGARRTNIRPKIYGLETTTENQPNRAIWSSVDASTGATVQRDSEQYENCGASTDLCSCSSGQELPREQKQEQQRIDTKTQWWKNCKSNHFESIGGTDLAYECAVGCQQHVQ